MKKIELKHEPDTARTIQYWIYIDGIVYDGYRTEHEARDAIEIILKKQKPLTIQTWEV